MNMNWQWIIKVFAITILFWAGTQTSIARQLKWEINHPNQAINVSHQQHHFQLVLASNPSTGYRWFLVHLPRHWIRAIGQRTLTIKKTQSRLSVPTISVWDFAMLHAHYQVPRLLKIKLLYAQPWNLKAGKEITFHIAAYPHSTALKHINN